MLDLILDLIRIFLSGDFPGVAEVGLTEDHPIIVAILELRTLVLA